MKWCCHWKTTSQSSEDCLPHQSTWGRPQTSNSNAVTSCASDCVQVSKLHYGSWRSSLSFCHCHLRMWIQNLVYGEIWQMAKLRGNRYILQTLTRPQQTSRQIGLDDRRWPKLLKNNMWIADKIISAGVVFMDGYLLQIKNNRKTHPQNLQQNDMLS